jgi:GT2 family glycosyltransferase
MIYIVIPVFNRINFTRECLISLRGQTYTDYKTLVVDDGSTDDTEEIIKREFPEVKVLKGDGNLWWTGATNMGIEYALKIGHENDFILTLNS